MFTHRCSATHQRILIVEDHSDLFDHLVTVNNSCQEPLEICGHCANAERAVEALMELRPSLVLICLPLKGSRGLTAVAKVKSYNKSVKILVASSNSGPAYASSVLRAGADGHVLKTEVIEEIIQAMRDVVNGFTYVSEPVARRIHIRRRAPSKVSSAPHSSEEAFILQLMGRGKNDQEIAWALGSSVDCVQAYQNRILRRAQLRTSGDLARYATQFSRNAALRSSSVN